ncbi:MAG: ATP-binding cassette domain-containing protein [Coriobacteriia bacterium]|nr:ATP-binding cassette domain-containing protein [Coriobacteriia bacterium]
MSGTPLLAARDIYAVREGDHGPVAVLDGVDFELAAGTLAEVVGPSGSGKTTFLLALARLLPGVTGELALDGASADGIAAQTWRTRVALLPQRPALVPGTVADNLRLPWTLKVRHGEQPPADAVLADALAGVGLVDVAPGRDVCRLSVGQIARIALLRVMLARPRVLLLDEPDASLDDASAGEVARLTAAFVAEGGSVVRVSHVRADASATARYRLADGRLEALHA